MEELILPEDSIELEIIYEINKEEKDMKDYPLQEEG